MKSKLSVLLFLCFVIQEARSQTSEIPGLSNIFLSMGFSNSNLRDVRSLYDYILEPYRSAGITIAKQKDVNGTAVIGLTFTHLFPGLPGSKIGAVLEYAYSPGYARYKDYAGSLDVNASVRSIRFAMLEETSILNFSNVEIFVRVEPGGVYSFASITENLKISSNVQANYSSKLAGSGLSFSGVGTSGFTFHFQQFLCSFEAGYRFSNVSGVEVSRGPKVQGELPEILIFDIDQSGFVFQCSVGLQI